MNLAAVNAMNFMRYKFFLFFSGLSRGPDPLDPPKSATTFILTNQHQTPLRGFNKLQVFHWTASISWLSHNAFVSGVGGLRFKSRADQIGHRVVNGSLPL